LGNVIWSWLQ